MRDQPGLHSNQLKLPAMACSVFMFVVMRDLSVKFSHVMWKQTNRVLTSCWNQVADEDSYVARQEKRIDELIHRCVRIEDRIEQVLAQLTDENQTTSDEVSVTYDYCEGLHCNCSTWIWIHIRLDQGVHLTVELNTCEH